MDLFDSDIPEDFGGFDDEDYAAHNNDDEDFGDMDPDMFEGEEDLVMEANAYERVGAQGKLSELLIGQGALADLQKKVNKENLTPEDRFLEAVNAISRKLNDNNLTTLSEEDINTMLEKATHLPGIKYKNPVAYILGYVATKGGRKMTPTTVKDVIDILPSVDEGGVTPPDVVRYSRYWMNII